MDELLNRSPNPAQPYVGKHAFAHKAGLHAAGIRADSQHLRAHRPALSWATTGTCWSQSSPAGAPSSRRPGRPGIEGDEDFAQRVVDRVKELEHDGFQFEAADGSFELLMRKEAGEYEPLFRLESWRVIVEKRIDGKVETEAVVKIWVDGERYVRSAEGNGPVHALDEALRSAIGEIYPHLRDIELVNFKVRILDERRARTPSHAC